MILSENRFTLFRIMLRSDVRQAEYVGHGVVPRLLAMRPERGLQRAVGEQHAILRMMRQRQALERAEEAYAVIAGRGAAAQGRKADVAGLARAGDAVAAAVCMLVERDAAAASRRLTQHQCRTRGRVDLHAVMGFDDLDVEALIKRLGDAL